MTIAICGLVKITLEIHKMTINASPSRKETQCILHNSTVTQRPKWKIMLTMDRNSQKRQENVEIFMESSV